MSDNPYQATAHSGTSEVQSGNYFFRPLNTLALLITIGIVICVMSGVGISLIETIAVSMFPSYTDPNAEISSQLEMNFIYGTIALSVASVLAHLGSAVVVCMFLYRANTNLRAHGHRLENTPGWCAGWWFIPIMNLFKPYYATKEIYFASRQIGTPEKPAADLGSGLLSSWWTCWIVGSILSRIENRLAINGVDLGTMALPLSWSSSLFLAGAGILLLKIVRNITRAHSNPTKQFMR